MKKIFMMLPLFAAILMTGCSSDDAFENNAPVKPAGESKFLTFSAGIVDDEDRITYDEANGRKVCWEKTDQIVVKVKDNTGVCKKSCVYGVVEDEWTESTTTAKFRPKDETCGLEKADFADGNKVEAYYLNSLLSDPEGEPTLPDTQIFSDDNISDVNPMYATLTLNDIQSGEAAHFYNLCGLLKINLNNLDEVPFKVKSIAINADKPLSGEFEIQKNELDRPAAVMTGTNAGITLTCKDDILSTTAKSFYIAMPEGTYSTFRVVVTDDNGETFTKTLKAGKSITIARNTRYNMTFPVDHVLLPGVFSVGEGKYVRFTRGNLYYNTSTQTSGIEINQYDTYPDLTKSSGSWDENHVSHFYFQSTVAKAAAKTCASRSSGRCFHFTDPNSKSNFSVYGRTDLRVLEGYDTHDGGIGSNEWTYLLKTRETAGIVSKAYITTYLKTAKRIGNVDAYGIFIFPDGYRGDGTDIPDTWEELNASGIVFLPTAGDRQGNTWVGNIKGYCRYWSSTGYVSSSTYTYGYESSTNNTNGSINSTYAVSIRLVKYVNAPWFGENSEDYIIEPSDMNSDWGM